MSTDEQRNEERCWQEKRSENGNERRLQTGREVKQELNLQDQVECLSQEPTATRERFSLDLNPS